jgi:Domain of unknown function (DUF4145)
MLYQVKDVTLYPARHISMRCPGCRNSAMLQPFSSLPDIQIARSIWAGQRCCPNGGCMTHVFVIFEPSSSKILAAYPPERLDFDATGIPELVRKAFDEAAGCHAAQCYTAAALMVRKTLEELCRDRGATGENLQARIESLRDKIIVPKDLLDGLHDLRLLGNDAAHVESRTFDEVRIRGGIRVHPGSAKGRVSVRQHPGEAPRLETPHVVGRQRGLGQSASSSGIDRRSGLPNWGVAPTSRPPTTE